MLKLHDFCLLIEKFFRVWSANDLRLLSGVLSSNDALPRIFRFHETLFKLNFFGKQALDLFDIIYVILVEVESGGVVSQPSILLIDLDILSVKIDKLLSLSLLLFLYFIPVVLVHLYVEFFLGEVIAFFDSFLVISTLHHLKPVSFKLSL